MIRKSRRSNKEEQTPCASCGFPYRDLVVYTFTPNESPDAPAQKIETCRKCDRKMPAAVVDPQVA